MNRMLATTLSLSAAVLAMMGNASAQTLVQTPPALSTTTLTAAVTFQDADTLYNQGVDAFGKMDYPGAIAKFQAAIAKRQMFTDAHFNLGVTLSLVNKPQDAITEFTWVINKLTANPNKKLADSYHERGRCYTALKQPDKALADFEQALKIRPDMKDVLIDRAAAYYVAQQYDKAIADYTAYFTGNAQADPLLYNNRGLAYMAKYGQTKADADVRAALADFDKYIAGNPQQNVDGYLGRGDANAALKAYDKAVADYTAYIAKNPKDAYALGARARCNMELKKYPDAVRDYETLHQINPGDTSATINLGIAQFQSGDYKGAIATISPAIGNPPKPADKVALNARAQAYVAAKDWANAAKDNDAILKIDPNESTAYFNRAVAYMNLGTWDKAVADFQAFINAKPKDPLDSAKAYQGMGTALLNVKKYPEAVDAFTKFIALNPKDKTGLYNRGVGYYNMAIGTNDKAAATKGIEDLEAYVASAPADKGSAAKATTYIAQLYPIAGKDQLPALNVAIEKNPTDAGPRVDRGIYYLKLNPPQYDKAIADFTSAYGMDSKDPSILYNRAIAYVGKKDWANVIKDTTAALAIKPNYPDALVTRADANFSSKAYANAIADYKQFASSATEPKDKAYGMKQLAAAYALNKDFQNAAETMTQYIAANPSNPEGLLLRAGYEIQLKKNDEAIKDLNDFMGKPPASDKKPEEVTAAKASAYFLRGLAYVNKEDYEKAGADFDQAYATKPDVASATQGAQAYAKLGAKILDTDTKNAVVAYTKAVGMYDKAITAAGTKPSQELADSYFNKAVTLESKYKADDGMVDDLKGAVEAYSKYVETGKALTPPPKDLADVQKQIDALKAKIAES